MAPLTDPQTRRIRRVLATAAAAAVVVLVPTACDYAIASDKIKNPADTSQSTPTGQSGQPAQSGHSGHGGTQNASNQTSTSAQPTTSAPAQAEEEGEQGQNGNQGQGQNGNGNQTQAPTTTSAAPTTTTAPAAPAQENNGLDVLARDCSKSDLEIHDGFQKGNRCVETAFGEVGDESKNPTLLITKSPDEVKAGTPFSLEVSTQNLIRDRFLGAAAGGYYLESSVLEGGIQRGHFHTACWLIGSGAEAPDPAPAPAFFLATQDNKGGAGVSDVRVDIPKLDAPGNYQCAVWAGDGSHRIPMMQRANQIPAFDSVRITVT
jgi:hypothetical protein